MAHRSARAALPVVLGVVVVDLIGFGIVMPILPFLAREHAASGAQLGLILSGWSAAQFLCAPLWGRLSDRYGRRPVLLATIAGTALSLFALALAHSLAALFAARLLAGAFAANVSVASAYVADATDESERTRWMGLIGAAFGIGFLLGPAIAALLAPWGHDVPMFAAAVLAVANLAHAALRLPESRGGESATAPRGRFEVLRSPSVRWLCIANGVFSLAVTQLEAIFQLFLMDRFAYDARQSAWILVGMAAVMAGIQGGGLRSLAARYSERSLVAVGALSMALAFAAVGLSGSLLPLLGALAISAAGRAVTQPSLMSLTSGAARAAERGAVMGAFQASASLARIFGPFVAGLLYDRRRVAPFLLASGLALAVSLLSRTLPARVADAETAAAVPGAGA
jgi:MFS family permease